MPQIRGELDSTALSSVSNEELTKCCSTVGGNCWCGSFQTPMEVLSAFKCGKSDLKIAFYRKGSSDLNYYPPVLEASRQNSFEMCGERREQSRWFLHPLG